MLTVCPGAGQQIALDRGPPWLSRGSPGKIGLFSSLSSCPDPSVPNRLSCILLATCLLTDVSWAGAGLELVNRLRSQAGLPALVHDAALEDAAVRHAAYLDRHHAPGTAPLGASAHEQRPGSEGFSGETPSDRALAASYPHREVRENLSLGYADWHGAVDGLMAAIYHRLTFLNFTSDQMGSAVAERSRVFLLGRSDISRLCAAPPAQALYRTPVDCLGQPMTRTYYDSLCATVPDEALFRPPHPVACDNGARLDAAFMAGVCEQPPPAAAFRGPGRYYVPCENGTEVDADWFDRLCEQRPPEAAYAASGRYVEICEPSRRVYAEWFEAQCAGLPAAARYRDSLRYRQPCADPIDVRVEYLDELDAARQRRLPESVTWPPDGATGVLPAFFVEEPDPLPDLEVSGYPVSIQFNPARVRRVVLQAFRLFRMEPGSPVAVERVRLLDQASDPHQLLSAFEFALFPLERLDWGAHYRVEVEALLDGQPRRLSWSFSTRGEDLPHLVVTESVQRFVVQPDKDYLLYLPPQEDRPHTVLKLRTRHLRGTQLNLTLVDPNTLQVRVGPVACDRVGLDFDDGHRVELVPAGCDG